MLNDGLTRGMHDQDRETGKIDLIDGASLGLPDEWHCPPGRGERQLTERGKEGLGSTLSHEHGTQFRGRRRSDGAGIRSLTARQVSAPGDAAG